MFSYVKKLRRGTSFYSERVSWSYHVLTTMESFRSVMSTYVESWTWSGHVFVSQNVAETSLFNENLHVVTCLYNFVETRQVG